MFEIKALKNFNPQYTKVFENLKFLQQPRYRTLWIDTFKTSRYRFFMKHSNLLFV
jgi:hypothetical protein